MDYDRLKAAWENGIEESELPVKLRRTHEAVSKLHERMEKAWSKVPDDVKQEIEWFAQNSVHGASVEKALRSLWYLQEETQPPKGGRSEYTYGTRISTAAIRNVARELGCWVDSGADDDFPEGEEDEWPDQMRRVYDVCKQFEPRLTPKNVNNAMKKLPNPQTPPKN